MLSILICDDSAQDRADLKKIINSLTLPFEISVSDVDGIETLRQYLNSCKIKPDIFIMDIELPDCGQAGNGIMIADELSSHNSNCQVIFVSAHKNYFEQVYDAEHVAFLSKPVNSAYLEKALIRAKDKISGSAAGSFLVTSNRESVVISENQFEYMERKLKCTYIHLVNGTTIDTYEKLDSILKKCTSFAIIRCHESFAFSLIQLSKCKNDEVVLKSGMKIPVSRRYRTEVHSAVIHYVTGGDHFVD